MNSLNDEVYPVDHRSGMIALVGRPNVGKSTLLNHLLGHKLSITSRKANTTRNRILGVLSEKKCQYIFIDLPGINTNTKRQVDRSINKTATSSMVGVDLVLFIVEYRGWQPQDTAIWNRIRQQGSPCVIAVSKMDRVSNNSHLLPIVEQIANVTGITEIVPVSALKSKNLNELKRVVAEKLPQGPPLFPLQYVTDKDEIFQTSELIREQIFRNYGDEIPYVCAIQIESYKHIGDSLEVDALIIVESNSQKRIIIGAQGKKLKRIGSEVQNRLEAQLQSKIHLTLWVKVRSQWTDNQKLISQFGYSEPE